MLRSLRPARVLLVSAGAPWAGCDDAAARERYLLGETCPRRQWPRSRRVVVLTRGPALHPSHRAAAAPCALDPRVPECPALEPGKSGGGGVADGSMASPPRLASLRSRPRRPRTWPRASTGRLSSRPRCSPVAVERATLRTASRVVCTWLIREWGMGCGGGCGCEVVMTAVMLVTR